MCTQGASPPAHARAFLALLRPHYADAVGRAIGWTAYGDVGPGHPTMDALDAAVPPAAWLAVEARAAERPAPPDHDRPADGAWTRVRYAAAAA